MFVKSNANRETMFMFSYCMTYVVHMGHYNAYTFTLVSSMCGHVLFTFDMYFIEVSNRVNSSLSFLLITKIRSFINQLPIIITIIYHKWDIFWYAFTSFFKIILESSIPTGDNVSVIFLCLMVKFKFTCIIIS